MGTAEYGMGVTCLLPQRLIVNRRYLASISMLFLFQYQMTLFIRMTTKRINWQTAVLSVTSMAAQNFVKLNFFAWQKKTIKNFDNNDGHVSLYANIMKCMRKSRIDAIRHCMAKPKFFHSETAASQKFSLRTSLTTDTLLEKLRMVWWVYSAVLNCCIALLSRCP